ncbi:hypothetical protein [Paenibacillus agilis]|uniref:hypothetical protein n=1 Tax=Paenibacillus agilis TaxID=3020863 RepID=UPI0016497DBA|nr:hypothetical protein [Paenibacillus agilis]
MTEQKLREIQEFIAKQVGHKVDIYHSEKHRVVGVFHHNTTPTPATAIEIFNY